MSFGFAPPAHKSSWRPFQVLALLEGSLATSGNTDLAPDELEPMSHKARLWFFEKCLRNGSPRKRRNVTSPLRVPQASPPPDRAPVEVPAVKASTAGSASGTPSTARPRTTPLAARLAVHLLASTSACPPSTRTRFGATIRPR
jgi:hypothetical protein